MENTEKIEKSLPKLLAEKKMEKIGSVLALVSMERSGLYEVPHTLKAGANGTIYFMAQVILDLLDKLKTEKEKKEEELAILEHSRVIEFAEQEIDMLYAVTVSGPKGKYTIKGRNRTEEKWKGNTLKFYDDHKEIFKAIKRKYLNTNYIYKVTPGQERRDFKTKLLQKILIDQDFSHFGIRLLDKALKKNSPD